MPTRFTAQSWVDRSPRPAYKRLSRRALVHHGRMGRQTIGFGLFGAYFAFLSAALMDGLARPNGEVFFAYAGDSPFTGDVLLDARNRILVIAAIGAAVGVVAGIVLWSARIRLVSERGVGRTVIAGLLGIALGLTPVLLALYGPIDYDFSPLWLYGANAVFAYALALVVVYLTLRLSDDDRAESTTRATAVALPIGAALATAGGVLAAWMLGFSTVFSTFAVVVCVVVGVLAATIALARAWATRSREHSI